MRVRLHSINHPDYPFPLGALVWTADAVGENQHRHFSTSYLGYEPATETVMPKHNKVQHRARGNMPALSVPYPVQVRILRENNQELRRVSNKVQRMLWIAVHLAKGRIVMDEGDYRAAMAMPNEDCIVSVEHNAKEKKVILIFTDKDGKRLLESEPKLVIATDA